MEYYNEEKIVLNGNNVYYINVYDEIYFISSSFRELCKQTEPPFLFSITYRKQGVRSDRFYEKYSERVLRTYSQKDIEKYRDLLISKTIKTTNKKREMCLNMCYDMLAYIDNKKTQNRSEDVKIDYNLAKELYDSGNKNFINLALGYYTKEELEKVSITFNVGFVLNVKVPKSMSDASKIEYNLKCKLNDAVGYLQSALDEDDIDSFVNRADILRK